MSDARRNRWAQVWVGALLALGMGGVLYRGIWEAQQNRPVSKGGTAAEFHMRRMKGRPDVVLSDLRGKVVMLDFWATWCGPCVEEIPVLTRLAQEYESRGLVFIAANRDEPATAELDVAQFVQRISPELERFVAFADDETSQRYRLRVLPTLYFIDRAGNVSDAHLGIASEPQLRRWIESALMIQ